MEFHAVITKVFDRDEDVVLNVGADPEYYERVMGGMLVLPFHHLKVGDKITVTTPDGE